MKNETLFLAQSNPMGMMNIVFIVAMIAVFYFFMIRPQNKKRKQLEQMRNNLKKGDHVSQLVVFTVRLQKSKKLPLFYKLKVVLK